MTKSLRIRPLLTWLAAVLLTIAAVSCINISADAVIPPKVTPISHRGYTANAPENTLEAFQYAAKAGFKYLETDVRECLDGEFFIMHDAWVTRTTDGFGPFNYLTSAEVRQLHVISGNRRAGVTYRVPSLTETLDTCARYKIIPVLHLKDVRSYDRFLSVCRRYSFYRKIIYMGDYAELEAIRSLDPAAKLMAVNWQDEDLEGSLKHFQSLRPMIMNAHFSHIQSENDTALMKQYGIQTPCAWVVNNISTLFSCVGSDCTWIVTDTLTPAVIAKANWALYYKMLERQKEEAIDRTAGDEITTRLIGLSPCSDISDSKFSQLKLSEKSVGANSITLSWNPYNAAKYYVYGAPLNRRPAKLAATTQTSYTVKRLATGNYYAFIVFAADRLGHIFSVSKTVYATPAGLAYTNCAKVAAPARVSLKIRQSVKLTPVLTNEKPSALVREIAPVRFYSSNTRVAKVSAAGKVTAVGQGSATVCSMAQNGRYAVTIIHVS